MKKFVIFTFLFCFSLIIWKIGNSYAELSDYPYYRQGQELKVYVGIPYEVKTNNPQRIVIGNPDILDIVKVTEQKIVIIGKKLGMTTLVWWDNKGQHTRTVSVYSKDFDYVVLRVEEILKEADIEGNVNTKILPQEGKIMLLGEVKNKEEKEKIKSILQDVSEYVIDLTKVREEEASVEIEVQVLELSRDAVRRLGFDLPSGITFTESSGPTATAATGLSALFHVSDWTRTAFTTTLDLLTQEGKARVLSRPRLLCRSGKEADLLVGGEVPIMTTNISDGGESTEVEYKEYGIKLKIKPIVVGEDKLDIDLQVEVSELGSAETIGASSAPTAKAYPLIKRNINTQLSLRNNSMVSIGGLIKQKTTEDLKKFPWLADIPVLGTFFRHKNYEEGGGSGQRGDIELFITLTPRIVYLEDQKIKEKISSKKIKALNQKELFNQFYAKEKIPTAIKDYAYKIQKYILENISYPSFLLDTGWEAQLVLLLDIDKEGKLKEAKIKQSSGYQIFDDQTLKKVKELTYPPLPAQLGLEHINVEIPILYKPSR